MTAPASAPRRPRVLRRIPPGTDTYIECVLCGRRGMHLLVVLRTGLCGLCTQVADRVGRVGQ